MSDWRKPVKVVAVKDAKVRDEEWRQELKAWANKMEDRFGREETPVGPIVTKEWIEYVEELESQNDDLRDMAEEFREEYQRRKDNGTEQRAWGIAHERCADEIEELIDDD